MKNFVGVPLVLVVEACSADDVGSGWTGTVRDSAGDRP